MSDRLFVFVAVAVGVALFLLMCVGIQALGVTLFSSDLPTQLVSSCSVP